MMRDDTSDDSTVVASSDFSLACAQDYVVMANGEGDQRLTTMVHCPPVVTPLGATESPYVVYQNDDGIHVQFDPSRQRTIDTKAQGRDAPAFDWGILLNDAAVEHCMALRGNAIDDVHVAMDFAHDESADQIEDVVYKVTVQEWRSQQWSKLADADDWYGHGTVRVNGRNVHNALMSGDDDRDQPSYDDHRPILAIGFRRIAFSSSSSPPSHKMVLRTCRVLRCKGARLLDASIPTTTGLIGNGTYTITSDAQMHEPIVVVQLHDDRSSSSSSLKYLHVQVTGILRVGDHHTGGPGRAGSRPSARDRGICIVVACVDDHGYEMQPCVLMPSFETIEETCDGDIRNDSVHFGVATTVVLGTLPNKLPLQTARVYVRWVGGGGGTTLTGRGHEQSGANEHVPNDAPSDAPSDVPPDEFAIELVQVEAAVVGEVGRAAARSGIGSISADASGERDMTTSIASYDDMRRLHDLESSLTDVSRKCQELEIKKGPRGLKGVRGPKGERGDAMRFDDLSSEQRRLLRGERGLPGERGKPLRFSDLSDDEKAQLRGKEGLQGPVGPVGQSGPPGPTGPPMTLDQLSDAEKEQIRGLPGEQGPRGRALTFADLTNDERRALRGEQGPVGPPGAPGPMGKTGMIGACGPPGAQGEMGERGLPGLPGPRGNDGVAGADGANGRDGRAFQIVSSFQTYDDVLEYVRHSKRLAINDHYMIDNIANVKEHGRLYRYTGTIEVDMSVECVYIDNLRAVIQSNGATLVSHSSDDGGRQQEQGMWRVLIRCYHQDEDEPTLLGMENEDDAENHHDHHGTNAYTQYQMLIDVLNQSNFTIHDARVVQEAIEAGVRICGVPGQKGPRGERGERGDGIAGLRVHAVGNEAMRLQLSLEHNDADNYIFLQVGPSKTSVAGFYIWERDGRRWSLLQGVDVESDFHEWMARFVKHPDDGAIPLALSLFASTKKQLEVGMESLRNALHEEQSGNERWKKFQFQQWKTVGASQYQQVVADMTELRSTLEGVVRQIEADADSLIRADEMNAYRKRVGQQLSEIERRHTTLQATIKQHVESEYLPVSRFENTRNEHNVALYKLNTDLIALMKDIEELKTGPWTVVVKQAEIELSESIEMSLVRIQAVEAKMAEREEVADEHKGILERLETEASLLTKEHRAHVHSVEEELKELRASSITLKRSLSQLVDNELRDRHESFDASVRDTNQQVAGLAHDLKDLRSAYKKVDARLSEHVKNDFTTALRAITEDANVLRKRVEGSELSSAQRLNTVVEDFDAKLLECSSEQTAKLQRSCNELVAKVEHAKQELQQTSTKSLYVVKHGVNETISLLRKQIEDGANTATEARGAIDHDMASLRDELLQHIRTNDDATSIRYAQQFGDVKSSIDGHEVQIDILQRELNKARGSIAAANDTWSKTHAEAEGRAHRERDKMLDKADAACEAKLLKSMETVQKKLEEYDCKQSEKGRALVDALTDTRADVEMAEKRTADQLVQLRQNITSGWKDAVDTLDARVVRVTGGLETNLDELSKACANDRRRYNSEMKRFMDIVRTNNTAFEQRLAKSTDANIASFERLHKDHKRLVEQDLKTHQQSTTGGLKELETKCSAIEYACNNRVDTVESHVQQLFDEGQRKYGKLIEEHSSSTLASLVRTRDDMMTQHKTQCEGVRAFAERRLNDVDARIDQLQTSLDQALNTLREQDKRLLEHERERQLLCERHATELKQLQQEATVREEALKALLHGETSVQQEALDKATTDATQREKDIVVRLTNDVQLVRGDAERLIQARAERTEQKVSEFFTHIGGSLNALDTKFNSLVHADARSIVGGSDVTLSKAKAQLDRVDAMLAAVARKHEDLICR